jgi:hypothetical protein
MITDMRNAGGSLTQGDQKAAAEAYARLARHEKLSRRDQEALKRFERQREEELRWKFYKSIPQKHWRQMSGRQAKVLNEQAERYGLPIGQAVIDLPLVVRKLHDFLAANAHKLLADDALMAGSGSPALEEYRRERAVLARLDRLEREGQLLPRDEVRDALVRMAALLRAAGDLLGRQFGSEAQDVLNEALDDVQAEISRSLADRSMDGALPYGDGSIDEEDEHEGDGQQPRG